MNEKYLGIFLLSYYKAFLDKIQMPKKTEVYTCDLCHFKSSKKSNYETHLATPKHKKIFLDNNENNEKNADINSFICKCGKIYKYLSGLSKHKKKCVISDSNNSLDEIDESTKYKMANPNELILFLVKENQEFKKMMIEMQKQLLQEQNKQSIELNKQILEIAKDAKTTTINNNCNNTNNNKFNMNIFLNEKCKDALNIMDFVTSLPLNLVDLEETGKQGYVKGLSRILINGLKDIDVSKRPIHCSDLKRETLYVKDNNVWEKEDTEKKRIKNAIKYISLKNAKQITKWTKENEGYRDSSNKKSDVYLKLVYEANGGDEDELNKIIKNISANVTIDK